MVHRYREAIVLNKPIVIINDMFEEIVIESIISFKENQTGLVLEEVRI